ncbi:MAG TPA: hypothetical protein VHE79_00640, partial [Spirochaetia bacterium]
MKLVSLAPVLLALREQMSDPAWFARAMEEIRTSPLIDAGPNPTAIDLVEVMLVLSGATESAIDAIGDAFAATEDEVLAEMDRHPEWDSRQVCLFHLGAAARWA